jgi:ketosteroid isomerase-like protein
MTPREVVNKMLTAWNQADRDTYMAVCDPDVVIDGVQRGPAQWAADYDTLHEAFRDCKLEVGKGEAQEGEWYNYEAIFTGTHTGVLKMPSRTGAGEIAPTGRAVRCEIAFCTRVVHDRIAEENGYGFAYALMPQLGGGPARR